MVLSILLFQSPLLLSQNLIIFPGARVIGSDGTIAIKNNIINNGSFTNSNNTIILNSPVNSIDGTVGVSFASLTIASGSTVTALAGGQTVRNILLCDGTLNSNGNFTLLSDSNGTAMVDGQGNGSISGNVTLQRYLPSGFGYKYFSSPFQSATAGEFSDEVNLSLSFPPVYRYDENRIGSGWVAYSNATNGLLPQSGYSVNLGNNPAPVTVDVSGVVNNGTLSTTIFNHNKTYTKGFNLVGNPYPSPIDWDIASGWSRTNIDNALYYFRASATDQYGGNYSTYIDGISSDGEANGIIPSMQGFFVHVSDGAWPVTGTLGLNNNARINDMTHSFLKSATMAKPLIRFAAGYSNDSTSYDPFVIYYDERATFNYDGQYDALKLFNTNPAVPNFYVFGSDGSKLSINALPLPGETPSALRLGLKTERNGVLIFKISSISDIYQNFTIYLTDMVLGVNQTLSSGNVYSVNLPAGDYQNRFYLNIAAGTTDIPEIVNPGENFKVYSAHGSLKAEITLPDGINGLLSVINLKGQVLYCSEIQSSGYYEFRPQISDGIYIVSLAYKEKRISKRIYFSVR